MKTEIVEITSAGIRKFLDKYTPEKAIAEFIWNGFDAKSKTIHIDFEKDESNFDTYKEIKITDYGTGISFEELSEKFKKFYESQKGINNNSDLTRGKNGYGRLTFYKFARFVKWNTVYNNGEVNLNYEIKVSEENLKGYTPTGPTKTVKETGTEVIFKDISKNITLDFVSKVLTPYLKAEFAWFLELNEEFKLFINGEELGYSSIFAETPENFKVELFDKNKNKFEFECKYIRWNNKLNDEYSRFYFLNNEYEFKNTKTTLLNKKGDNFWHSIVVINDFFNEINSEQKEGKEKTIKLFEDNVDVKVFKELIEKLNEYLRVKRRPFLKKQATILIEKYESDKVFPEFGNEEWDTVRKTGLKDLVRGIYEIEPAVFTKLNKKKKRIKKEYFLNY